MRNKNNNNNNHLLAAATIFTLTIMAVSSMGAPAAATATTTGNATTTTMTPSSSSGIELSSEPVYQERFKEESQTLINETHFRLTYSGNGTLTLPNSTESIRTTSTGSGIVSMMMVLLL
jgi:hypothetical protein